MPVRPKPPVPADDNAALIELLATMGSRAGHTWRPVTLQHVPGEGGDVEAAVTTMCQACGLAGRLTSVVQAGTSSFDWPWRLIEPPDLCAAARGRLEADEKALEPEEEPEDVLELLLEVAEFLDSLEGRPETILERADDAADLAERIRAYAALDPHPLERAYIDGMNSAVDLIRSALNSIDLGGPDV
jgi:hypothetical protein